MLQKIIDLLNEALFVLAEQRAAKLTGIKEGDFLHFRGRFLHSVIRKRIVRIGFPTVDITYVVQVIEVSVHMNLE